MQDLPTCTCACIYFQKILQYCIHVFSPVVFYIFHSLILHFHTCIHTSFAYSCSGSLIRDNYEALVSHVERLTHHDAMTLLRITRSDARRRTGRTPRTAGEHMRAMESMGEVLLFRAIMGSSGITPPSYEVYIYI